MYRPGHLVQETFLVLDVPPQVVLQVRKPAAALELLERKTELYFSQPDHVSISFMFGSFSI